MKVIEFYDRIIDNEIELCKIEDIILIGLLDFIRRCELVGGACSLFNDLRISVHNELLTRNNGGNNE